MTEKRYVVSELDPISVLDMDTGDTFPIADGSGFVEAIVECLNVLHEENQALKSDRARYEEECRLDVFKELHEENEQLKKELDQFYLLIGRGDWSGLVDLIKGDVE